MTAPRLTHTAHTAHTASGGGKVRFRMRSSGLLFTVILVFAFGALGTAGTVARAEDSAPNVLPDFLASPPALPASYDERTAWRLDLTEALKIAMQQNLGISFTRKGLERARLSVESATADMYEPRLDANYVHDANSSVGSASKRDSGSVSLSQRLPTGASLSVGLSASGSDSASPVPLPGSHGSSLTFSLTQPILKGFSPDLAIPQASILSARIESETARRQLEIDAAALVEKTESAYWGVVSALYSYGVQLKSQKAAEDTVKLVHRQIEAGMATGSDLTGAESTFAQSKLDVLRQEAAVEDAWDALRLVLNLPRDQWTRPILPTAMPRLAPAEPPSEEQALEIAINHRPDFAILKLQMKASDLALRIAANDRLPDINVGLTGSLSGQGDSYGGALTDLGHQTRDWSVTVGLSWTPLGRGNHVKRELSRIQHEVDVAHNTQRVQEIWNEIRAAVRRQRAAAREVTAAFESLALANKYLAEENRRYLEGTSSNLNIATLQSRLVSAEQQALQALLSNESTQASLRLVTGQLLEQRHIQFEVGK